MAAKALMSGSFTPNTDDQLMSYLNVLSRVEQRLIFVGDIIAD